MESENSSERQECCDAIGCLSMDGEALAAMLKRYNIVHRLNLCLSDSVGVVRIAAASAIRSGTS